jgi:hypothetical protein
MNKTRLLSIIAEATEITESDPIRSKCHVCEKEGENRYYLYTEDEYWDDDNGTHFGTACDKCFDMIMKINDFVDKIISNKI